MRVCKPSNWLQASVSASRHAADPRVPSSPWVNHFSALYNVAGQGAAAAYLGVKVRYDSQKV
jgi:hypothetical protein